MSWMHELAAIIGRNSGDPALEELLEGCYRPQAEQDPVGALQYAMNVLQRRTAFAEEAAYNAVKAGDVQQSTWAKPD